MKNTKEKTDPVHCFGSFSFNGPLLCDGFRPPKAVGAAFAKTTARPRSPMTLSQQQTTFTRKCCDKENCGEARRRVLAPEQINGC